MGGQEAHLQTPSARPSISSANRIFGLSRTPPFPLNPSSPLLQPPPPPSRPPPLWTLRQVTGPVKSALGDPEPRRPLGFFCAPGRHAAARPRPRACRSAEVQGWRPLGGRVTDITCIAEKNAVVHRSHKSPGARNSPASSRVNMRVGVGRPLFCQAERPDTPLFDRSAPGLGAYRTSRRRYAGRGSSQISLP